MKKILCLVLLVGFAHPQTGNDFLKEYPFGKSSPNDDELLQQVRYTWLIRGIIDGNVLTLMGLERQEGFFDDSRNLHYRTCNMHSHQLIRIIKKWCDDNPDKTHYNMHEIVYLALTEIPAKSSADCK